MNSGGSNLPYFVSALINVSNAFQNRIVTALALTFERNTFSRCLRWSVQQKKSGQETGTSIGNSNGL